MNDFKKVSELILGSLDSFVKQIYPNGKKVGHYWVTGDVFDAVASGNGSFKICLQGKHKGLCRDFNGGDKSFDLIDAYSIKNNVSKSEALREIAQIFNFNVDNSIKTESKSKKSATKQSWTAKLSSRLHSNEAALRYLYSRSLSIETINEFKLGLSFSYTRQDGLTTVDALVVPIRKEDGSFANVNAYYAIKDVTQNPTNENGWMKGSPQAYFTHPYRKQTKIFICEGIKDAWVIYQNLKENNLLKDILVCSSTHGSSIPDTFKDESFWGKFDKIYLGHDHDSAGDRIAEKLTEYIPKDCYRVKCPISYAQNAKYTASGEVKPQSEWGADWTDFFKADSCIEEFLALLDDALTCTTKIDESEHQDNFNIEGRFNVSPTDINNAYINGKMYGKRLIISPICEHFS